MSRSILLSVEGPLTLGEVAKAAPVRHLGLQGAVKALLLALGLRMSRPSVQPRTPNGISQALNRVKGSPLGSLHGEPPSISMASGKP